MDGGRKCVWGAKNKTKTQKLDITQKTGTTFLLTGKYYCSSSNARL